MIMGHILKIQPVFKEMIWGGHKLRDVYGYDIPSDSTGECWASSGHQNVQLVMENIKEKLFLGYGKIIVNFL